MTGQATKKRSGSRLWLVPCGAEPRHWKVYGYWNPESDYPPPCMYCAYDDVVSAHDGDVHAKHWPWRRWKASHRIAAWLITSGICYGGYGFAYDAHCRGCLISLPSWGWGPRRYVLGVPVESWRCLLRRHHIPTKDKVAWGMCSKCVPCAECGSTEAFHRC